jgi:mannose-6-phosphate isomerase-like protein (cupin superfamily)
VQRATAASGAHIREEAELVLEGRLEAHIGEREFLLSPGDSIRFNCAIPHWFRTFNERAIVISAMTPPSF